MKIISKRFFHDDDGNIVLFQPPNAPILAWLIAMLASHITAGTLELFCKLVAFGALFTWAWLELFNGVNYFRRCIGAAILILIVVSAAMRGGL